MTKTERQALRKSQAEFITRREAELANDVLEIGESVVYGVHANNGTTRATVVGRTQGTTGRYFYRVQFTEGAYKGATYNVARSHLAKEA
jgi:hypothetical protein